jgi:Cu/Ag efflux protein CusF
MRLYKVILLVNLAIAIGFVFGSLWWGQEIRRLRREVNALGEGTAAQPAVGGSWSTHGIVRVITPEINRIFIDHGEVPGLMEAMTMAFEPEDPKILNGLSPGDQVRFTLRRKGEHLFLVAIEKEHSP